MERWINKIICGDCLEVMREMPDECFDLVLTDPPYVGLTKTHTPLPILTGVAPIKNVSHTIGDPWDASLDWLNEAWRVAKLGLMVFCSYRSIDATKAALPSSSKPIALFTWHKVNAPPSVRNAPRHTTEFIWAFQKRSGLKWHNIKDTMFDIPMLQAGCMATERILGEDGKAAHPSQKPIRLIKNLLIVEPASVLDCFFGTGTTGVAAAQLGISWCGIERDPQYVQMAEDRIKRETAQLNAFHQIRRVQ